MTTDTAGNVYVADSNNHTIRKVTPAGDVTTLAGTPGSYGQTNGTGTAARFYNPGGVAVDATGNVYVADSSNHAIRKVTPDGVVTTLAGTPGSSGRTDGAGTAARFYYPYGLAVDATGNVYVADSNNHPLRKVTPDGVVTTFAGSTSGLMGSTDAIGTAARFYYPYGLAVDAAGNLFVADSNNSTIRRISPAGVVTTIGGSPLITGTGTGAKDGVGGEARFYYPRGIAVDNTTQALYVVDSNNYRVSKGIPTSLPIITTTGLQTGMIASFYDQALTVTGGTPPYTWSVASGSLPAGLSLTGSGVITGVPTTFENANVTVQVIDSRNLPGAAAFSLSIVDPTAPPAITSTSLAVGVVGRAYSQPLTATGGVPPYTWVLASGSLPNGLSLGEDGVISGTPAAAGAATFTVQAKGANTLADAISIRLVILEASAVPFITSTSLMTGMISTGYSQTLAATGGALPYTWSIASGNLPSGLTFSSAGIITGTPVATGSTSFTVRVAGSDALASTQAFTLVISRTPPTISSSMLITGTISRAYSYPLFATGGMTPYTWSVAAGSSLPAGLSLSSSSGLVTGTPTAVGTTNVTIQVSGDNAVSTKNITITIAQNTPVFFGYDLPAATAGVPYNQILTATAGAPPYTWAVISGSLPAGFTLSRDGVLTGLSNVPGTSASFTIQVIGTDALSSSYPFTLATVENLYAWANLAGLPRTSGNLNGTGTAARFSYPNGGAVDSQGNLYVTDKSNHTIRKVTPAGVVTTLAGNPGLSGSTDGVGSTAKFYSPYGIAIDAADTLYVTDYGNHTIRKVTTPDGTVTTFAGSPAAIGYTDGAGSAARFYNPAGVAVDAAGTVYVADNGYSLIRKITPDGAVTTLAGLANVTGNTNGTGSAARFNHPTGVTVDAAGTVYVADYYSYNIRKITPSGTVSTFAGGGIPGNTDGTGSNARFFYPAGVAVDASGTVYVAENYSNTIRKITPAGVVTTIGGSPDISGASDGVGGAARFYYPYGIAVDSARQTLYAMDSQNNRISKGTLVFPPAISGLSLPTATANCAYSQALTATGGATPYAWSLAAGNLPDGLSLASDGVLSGAPAAGGIAGFTVRVTGANALTATAAFTLVVADPVSPPTITTIALTPCAMGLAYSQALAATGGTPPYAWALTAGSLPEGLSLDSHGLINGSPAATGTASFTVQVTGANGLSAAAAFTLAAVDTTTPPVITTTSLAAGNVGIAYSQPLAATGVAPCAWTLATGSLPASLSLNPVGIITGTPITTGTASFTVRVTGANAISSTRSFLLAVAPGAPTIATSILTTGTLSRTYTYNLTATGGTSPYSWSVAAGSLPAGLTLSGSGIISGTPVALGIASVTLRATGGNGLAATKTFTLPIAQNLPVFVTGTVAAGTVGVPYNQILTATSGALPYTWSVISGSLPAGLTLSGSGVITGIPTVAGPIANVTIMVTGRDTLAASRTFSLTIVEDTYAWANFAGLPRTIGSLNGTGTAARFYYPYGGAVDSAGNLYVADRSNHTIRKVTPDGAVSTLAGSPGSMGNTNGTGTAARFNYPSSVAVDAAGTLYVADASNHTIRKVTTPDGVVTTLAGSPGSFGSTDGAGNAARFYSPNGVAVDAAGTVYVADSSNYTIRKITPEGMVTTLAGSPGSMGSTNGAGNVARFFYPCSVAVDAAGTIYVADSSNYAIRKVTPEGAVTTLASGGFGNTAAFYYPRGVAVDGAGNVYVADTNSHAIRKITPAGAITTIGGSPGISGFSNGLGGEARFYSPNGLAVDRTGSTVYVFDSSNYRVSKGTPPAPPVVTTTSLASGTMNFAYGQPLAATGGATPYSWSLAEGSLPAGLSLTGSGILTGTPAATGTAAFSVRVTDANALSAKATLSLAVVEDPTAAPVITTTSLMTGASSFAYEQALTVNGGGSSKASWAVADGSLPEGLSLNENGVISGTPAATGKISFSVKVTGGNALSSTITFNLLIVAANTPPAITTATLPDGTLGSAYTQALAATGVMPYTWTMAAGSLPAGLSLSSAGLITGTPAAAIAAAFNVRVTGGNAVSSTQAFNLTIAAGAPAIATASLPTGTASQAYTVSLAATGGTPPYAWTVADGSLPAGLTLSGSGILTGTPVAAGTTGVVIQAAGADAQTITKTFYLTIVESYVWSTFVGSPGESGSTDATAAAARFFMPAGVTVDADGNLYVADTWNSTIRKVTADGAVSTLAGSPGETGNTNDTGSAARFYNPDSLAVDTEGNLYVADSDNHAIRKVTPDGAVSILAGSPDGTWGSDNGDGAAARFYHPDGIVISPDGNLYVADSGNSTIRKITLDGAVSTLAGSPDETGSTDDTGAAARFNHPDGIAVDAAGNLYIADSDNSTLRKITTDGAVSTLAGIPGVPGSADGAGNSARFSHPDAVAIDGNGNLYVADSGNHTIRKVTPAGEVITIGGAPEVSGSADGASSSARFNSPTGITVDTAGNIYVADSGNHTIRMTAPIPPTITTAPILVDGIVNRAYSQPLAATGGAMPYAWSLVAGTLPSGLSLTGSSGILTGTPVATGAASFTARVTDANAKTSTQAFALAVVEATPLTILTANLLPAGFAGLAYSNTLTVSGGVTPYTWSVAAGSSLPAGISLSAAGILTGTPTVANTTSIIVQVTDAEATTFTLPVTFMAVESRTWATLAGTPGATGATDGIGAAARFYNPCGMTVDADGNLYVADSSNHTIRMVMPAGIAYTIAGSPGLSGSDDGIGAAARFSLPYGIAVDAASKTLYVADTGNSTIRKITADGAITTLAGSPGETGSADGAGADARFRLPYSVTVDGKGTLYVADTYNHTIRKVSADGTVSTFAGSPGLSGNDDGTGDNARFNTPNGVAVDADGTLYVADSGNHAIRMITADGTVTTLAGSAQGIPGSADGALADARFNGPTGIAIDRSNGNLYVADNSNHTIRLISPAGMVVTIGGTPGVDGSADGANRNAKFNLPYGLAVNADGNLYVADTNNGTIRTTAPLQSSPTLVAASLPTGTASVAYSLCLTATGGTAPYAWFIAAGSLPDGLNLIKDNGIITGTPVASGTASFTVRVTGANALSSTQAFSLAVKPAPPAPGTYAAWIDAHPAVGGKTAFDDDPDGDGIRNGMERYLGADPSQAAGAPALAQIAGTPLEMTFRHSRGHDLATDVTVSYEWSPDLTHWYAAGATGNGVTVTIKNKVVIARAAPLNDEIEVTASVTGGSTAKLFVRLMVTQNPPP